MAELKPCPFCGGEAFLSENVYDLKPGNVLLYFVECGGCNATTTEYGYKYEAIEAWNRRAENGK